MDTTSDAVEKLTIDNTKWVLNQGSKGSPKGKEYYHLFEYYKIVSQNYDFPKEFNVTSANYAERHANQYLEVVDKVMYDLNGAMKAVEIMKKNPKQLTEFFELIARDNPNVKIISSKKKDHATEFQNLLKNFKDIMRNKVNFDDAFWNILSETNSWITGGIMAGKHDDIDIVCEPNTIMEVVDAIYEEYLDKPSYEIISSKQSSKYRVTIEVSKEKKVTKLDIFQGVYTSFDTVANFHFGCVKALYNGTKFRCLPSYIVTMYTGIMYDSTNNTTENLEYAAAKYIERGFSYLSNADWWDRYVNHSYYNFTSKKFTTYPLAD